MHASAHTYATRAIESGMQPKVLQKLLGHASIKTTMDRYVHVTDETLDMSVSVYLNKDKHRIINKVSRNNELVTGFLESDLRRKFPDYLTSIYMARTATAI